MGKRAAVTAHCLAQQEIWLAPPEEDGAGRTKAQEQVAGTDPRHPNMDGGTSFLYD